MGPTTSAGEFADRALISGLPRRVFFSYLAVFVLVAGLAAVAYRLIDRGAAMMGCRVSSQPDTFLAYCDSKYFGDYEHGAYYFGTEPRAIAHLQRAEVIAFGSSRAQFAFSAEAVRR